MDLLTERKTPAVLKKLKYLFIYKLSAASEYWTDLSWIRFVRFNRQCSFKWATVWCEHHYSKGQVLIPDTRCVTNNQVFPCLEIKNIK